MKDWWNQLSLRDKRTAFFGAIIVVIALLYALILAPLATKNAFLRTQIEHDKQLLVWMKAANKKILALQKSPQTKPSMNSTASALSITQDQIKESPFADKFSQLKQAENEGVQLNFQTVNFDALIAWLTMLWEQYGLVVAQTTITPTGTAGSVNADIILQKV
jgi:type II secretory pathway component PulM